MSAADDCHAAHHDYQVALHRVVGAARGAVSAYERGAASVDYLRDRLEALDEAERAWAAAINRLRAANGLPRSATEDVA